MAQASTAGTVLPPVNQLNLAVIGQVLAAGWRDFRQAPKFGIFFSAVYALGGLALTVLGAGTVVWTLALSLGFPLVAPFAAVGIYEVSRRLETGEALNWPGILGVIWAERGRQIPWLGAIIVIYFLFWTFLAHMIFALFLGLSAMINVSTSYEVLFTGPGLVMMGAELVVGGVLAFLLFSLTVVALPLLLDREVDFVTAMLISLKVVRENTAVMLVWAAVLAATILVALIPLFLGLLIALPVLGHASWHMYRRALP